ncbi:MAG: threonine synthase [Propionibacteriaceae bacterium]|nr:threonine synthase [Propionibacteriaceae bacterium]
MKFISTRGGAPQLFSDVLLEGLAADGGLYVPEAYPQVSAADLACWRHILADEGYAGLAFQVLKLFIDDIPEDDLYDLCQAAYSSANFGSMDVVHVSQVEDELWLAHLSNGPTAAFKDMAMQLLGRLFEHELARRGTTLNVLGATSGDTGSAAEYALLGRAGVTVAMLTPAGRMSDFQQAQMYSIDDPAIANIAVDGVFDDCQDLVKAVNLDADFKAEHRIGAVNSINVARLLSQVVYAFAAYLQVSGDETTPIAFAVPTGNFGDIMSAYVAKRMGLPVGDLILATNENTVLAEFFATGIYRPRSAAATYATSSPSMDISKASNLERFIFDLVGREPQRAADLFGRQLVESGQFDLSGDPAFKTQRDTFGIIAGTSTHADRLATIKALWEAHGVLIDPHTADGVHVAQALRAAGATSGPVIAYETALPVKFSATIEEAIGQAPPTPPRFAGIEGAPRHVVPMPNDADALKAWLVDWLPVAAASE